MCPKAISETTSGKPMVALAVMSAIWGYNWVVMKEGLRFCDPFVFAAIRVIPAAILLFGILVWTKEDWRPRQVGWTVLLGLFSTTLGYGLPLWALAGGTAGKTAILLYTMPFWTIMLAWPILGERVRGLEWLSVVFAFVGLALIMADDAAQASLWPAIIAVIAGIAWAGSAIVTRIMRRDPEFDVLSVTTWQMIYGVGPLIVIAAVVPTSPVQWTSTFIVVLLYNVFLVGVVALLLWFYILERLEAGMATMGTLVTPVIALVSARIQLGEIPSSHETLGIILILLGIGLLGAIAFLRNHRVEK